MTKHTYGCTQVCKPPFGARMWLKLKPPYIVYMLHVIMEHCFACSRSIEDGQGYDCKGHDGVSCNLCAETCSSCNGGICGDGSNGCARDCTECTEMRCQECLFKCHNCNNPTCVKCERTNNNSHRLCITCGSK